MVAYVKTKGKAVVKDDDRQSNRGRKDRPSALFFQLPPTSFPGRVTSSERKPHSPSFVHRLPHSPPAPSCSSLLTLGVLPTVGHRSCLNTQSTDRAAPSNAHVLTGLALGLVSMTLLLNAVGMSALPELQQAPGASHLTHSARPLSGGRTAATSPYESADGV